MIGLGPRAGLALAATSLVGVVATSLGGRWYVGALAGLATWLVAVVIDTFRATDPAGVEVERVVPSSIVTGTRTTARWRLRHGAASTVRVDLADSFPPSWGTQRRAGVQVPPVADVQVDVEIRPTRRGRFELDELVVRTTGPWRLALRQRRRSVPQTVKVVPAFLTRREIELRRQRASLLDVGSRSVRAFGGGTEFDQLRDYTPDDQFRHIDWSASARSGRAIVRTYRAEEHETMYVVLDNGRLMAAKADGVPRLEHAMDAVMGLATVADHIGDRLGLVAVDQRVHDPIAPSRGHRHLGRLIESMYDLEPVLAETDYAKMAAELLARLRRRTTIILLTDLHPHVVQAALAPAVRALTLRHDVVVGAVRSSLPDTLLHTVPDDAGAAHLQTAALRAATGRRQAAAAFESIGVRVIDAPAGELGPRLVDDYLLAKRRV